MLSSCLIDFPYVTRIHIVIEARDSSGSTRKTGNTILDIQIDDVNDNAPSVFLDIIVKSLPGTGDISYVYKLLCYINIFIRFKCIKIA